MDRTGNTSSTTTDAEKHRARERAYERRQRANILVVPVEIGPEETTMLNEIGALDMGDLDDRPRIAGAIKEAIRMLAAVTGEKSDASVPSKESPGLCSQHGHEPKPAGGK